MKKLYYVFAALFIVASAPLVHAQKLIERTVAVFDFAPMINSEAEYSSICADTIAIELERIGYTVIDTNVIRKSYKGSLVDEPALIQFAKTQKADVVVMGFYIIEGGSLHIGVRAIDILTGLTAVSAFNTGKGGVAIFNTIDAISAQVAQKIREALQPLPESELIVYREVTKVETKVIEEVIEQGTPVSFIIKSPDEGAQVFSGDTLLGTIEKGELVINSKEGANLVLTIKKEGSYPRTVQIAVSAKKPVHTIRKLQPVALNDVQAQLSHDRPFGLYGSYSRAIFPEIFYYGGMTGFFVIPLDYSFDSPDHDPRTFFELPLYATLAFYPLGIFAPQYVFQPYLKIGLGGELYCTNFPDGFNFGAITARGSIALGMLVVPGTVAVILENLFISPPIVSLGLIKDLPFTMHLLIGVRYIWR